MRLRLLMVEAGGSPRGHLPGAQAVRGGGTCVASLDALPLPAAPSRKRPRAASGPVVSLTAEDVAAEDGLPASKVLLL